MLDDGLMAELAASGIDGRAFLLQSRTEENQRKIAKRQEELRLNGFVNGSSTVQAMATLRVSVCSNASHNTASTTPLTGDDDSDDDGDDVEDDDSFAAALKECGIDPEEFVRESIASAYGLNFEPHEIIESSSSDNDDDGEKSGQSSLDDILRSNGGNNGAGATTSGGARRETKRNNRCFDILYQSLVSSGHILNSSIEEAAMAETAMVETAMAETAMAETAMAETAMAETAMAETAMAGGRIAAQNADKSRGEGLVKKKSVRWVAGTGGDGTYESEGESESLKSYSLSAEVEERRRKKKEARKSRRSSRIRPNNSLTKSTKDALKSSGLDPKDFLRQTLSDSLVEADARAKSTAELNACDRRNEKSPIVPLSSVDQAEEWDVAATRVESNGDEAQQQQNPDGSDQRALDENTDNGSGDKKKKKKKRKDKDSDTFKSEFELKNEEAEKRRRSRRKRKIKKRRQTNALTKSIKDSLKASGIDPKEFIRQMTT